MKKNQFRHSSRIERREKSRTHFRMSCQFLSIGDNNFSLWLWFWETIIIIFSCLSFIHCVLLVLLWCHGQSRVKTWEQANSSIELLLRFNNEKYRREKIMFKQTRDILLVKVDECQRDIIVSEEKRSNNRTKKKLNVVW